MLTTFDACPTKCDDKSQEENDAPIKTPFYLDFELLVLREFRLSFYLGVQLLIELSEQSEYFTICLYCVKVVQVTFLRNSGDLSLSFLAFNC